MKKAMIAIIILFVAFIVAVPPINDLLAKNVEKGLLEIALPENTQMVESVSKAGPWLVPGNFMDRPALFPRS